MPLHNVKDIYWAAGFLEGEGSFVLIKAEHSVIRVQAAQVQREPLERLLRMFGGVISGPYKYSDNPKVQPRYDWSIRGVKAVGVAMTVYGLMSPKRQQQIKHVLDIWHTAPVHNKLKATCNEGHQFDKVVPVGDKTRRRCGTCDRASGLRYYYSKGKATRAATRDQRV